MCSGFHGSGVSLRITSPLMRDAERQRFVARLTDVAAGIVGAVTRDIDGAPLGLERRPRELGHGGINAAADRGAVGERTRRFKQPVAKSLGGFRAINDRPVDHDLLVAKSRPFEKQHADAATSARSDRVKDARIGECRGIAFALQAGTSGCRRCARHRPPEPEAGRQVRSAQRDAAKSALAERQHDGRAAERSGSSARA